MIRAYFYFKEEAEKCPIHKTFKWFNVFLHPAAENGTAADGKKPPARVNSSVTRMTKLLQKIENFPLTLRVLHGLR